MDDRTLLVLGKAPEPGKTKTRMVAGGLSPTEAAALQLACLRDLIARDFGDVQRRLYRKGGPSALIWDEARRLGWNIADQAHLDLGSNLADAFAATLPGQTIALGTDSPDLPEALIDLAWQSFAHADVVLGPSFDGGYYLIGLRRMEPGLFEGIRWGSADVFESTVSRAHALGLPVAVLPFWYDLDEVADLRRLRLQSRLDRQEHTPHRATHVLKFLETIPSVLGAGPN